MLYEHNYPAPNDGDRYANGYAQNIPTVPGSYAQTGSTSALEPTSGYGQPGQTNRPIEDGYTRPTMSGNGYSNAGISSRPPSPISTSPTGYYDRDDRYNKTNRYGGMDNKPVNSPGQGGGYGGSSGSGSGSGYGTGSGSGYGTGSSGYGSGSSGHGSGSGYGSSGNGDKYQVTEPTIETYFNPDDYYRPGSNCKYLLIFT